MEKIYFQYKTAFDVCDHKYLINVSGRITDKFLSDPINYDSIPNHIKELFKIRERILNHLKVDETQTEICYAVIHGNPYLKKQIEKQMILITGTDTSGIYGYLVLEPNKEIKYKGRIYGYFPFEPTNEEVEIEMSEILIEIHEKDFLFEFLDYHFNNCFESTEDFLNYFNVFLKKFFPSNVAAFLDMSKKLRQWLNNKVDVYKIHLDEESKDNFWIEQPTIVEAVEENEESDAELEKTAHKVVLLHELGVIGHLQKRCKEKNPTMSDTKFAELIGLILGLQGKKINAVRKGISGYGQGTKDDPKTQKALQKVRSELLKFGIEL